MRAPDVAFTDKRLAVLYDDVEGDRTDLDAYVAIADELAVASFVDIGCGTGSLAIRLARRGRTVVGVDPALASLEVARAKWGADRVIWVHGDATALAGRGLSLEMAVMTGNVAQVFVSDEDWQRTLAAVHGHLQPGGWFCSRPGARRSATGRDGMWLLRRSPCPMVGPSSSPGP